MATNLQRKKKPRRTGGINPPFEGPGQAKSALAGCVNRNPTVPPSSIFADELFRPTAALTSEIYEVRLGLPDFVPCYHHEHAAAQTDWILSGIQRIE
jgi:hypothetical protein